MPFPESNRLIKAHSRRSPGSSASFNIEDLRRQCDDYVAHARSQAESLVADAAVEAETIRRQAFEQGRDAGQELGFEAARELIESRARELAAIHFRDQLGTTLPAIERMIDALERERERWLIDGEAAVVRLSAIIAEKLVRRELSQRPGLAIDGVREALQLVAGSAQTTVRLHPIDLEQLNDHGQDIVERLSRAGKTALTPDESLSRGDCLVETQHGAIDARIETQLARIVDEILHS